MYYIYFVMILGGGDGGDGVLGVVHGVLFVVGGVVVWV